MGPRKRAKKAEKKGQKRLEKAGLQGRGGGNTDPTLMYYTPGIVQQPKLLIIFHWRLLEIAYGQTKHKFTFLSQGDIVVLATLRRLACLFEETLLYMKQSRSFKCSDQPTLARGLLGTGRPDPTLESASPSPPQGSIWHRFNIDSTLIRHRFPDLTLFRCQIDP